MSPAVPHPARVRVSRGLAAWLALSFLMFAGGTVEIVVREDPALTLLVPLGIAAALALCWWRPLTGLGVMVAVTLVQAPLGNPLHEISFPLYAFAAGMIMAAARVEGARVAVAALYGVIMISVVLLFGAEEPFVDALIALGLIVGLPLLTGRMFRSRSRLNDELREQARRMAGERQARAEEAAAAERRRIAGELHDIVAHGVSGMVVQAGAARRLVGKGDPRAAEAIRAVEDGGREALTELRRLLGVLRRDDADLALAPQPSLARLGALVAKLREGGADVVLEVEGEYVPMSPGVDVAGYRVVEEALRAAGSERVTVTVRYGDRQVDLVVDGAAPGPVALVGLRERVTLFGGRLHTARRGEAPTLRAELPLFGGVA